jgi:3-deoxy-7-phosphoheptulonate synthase
MQKTYNTDDLRISDTKEVIPPDRVHKEIPISAIAANTILRARKAVHDILYGDNDRLLVIVGPCSIHDPLAALEYARKLKVVKDQLEDDLQIVMRVYFEKPRTSIGWKGLINDPTLDDKFEINDGLAIARQLLLELAEAGMPTATEYLDLISPQYISDLVSWAAIGARTTESQGHRELASGVSCIIGFKNGTYGNTDVALNAVSAAARPHNFLSVDKDGRSAIFTTSGNEDCHVILRGGREPNYKARYVNQASQALKAQGLPSAVMVDCSHANSSRDYRRQALVARNVAEQLRLGSQNISGVMIESHLVGGNQKAASRPLEELVYGQSITDACIDWDTTETVLNELALAVQVRRTINQKR